MEYGFLWLWVAVIIQRIVELRKAKKNTMWIKKQGGYEVGRNHYPLILAIHVLFFLGIVVETLWLGAEPPRWWLIPFLLFILLQGARIWCIQSLGPYWNTRVWVIPGHFPRMVGPYRYIKHPNYLLVILEIAIFPLIFGAYLTAGVITLLNAFILLFIRIPVEEKALTQVMHYKEKMNKKKYFLPTIID